MKKNSLLLLLFVLTSITQNVLAQNEKNWWVFGLNRLNGFGISSPVSMDLNAPICPDYNPGSFPGPTIPGPQPFTGTPDQMTTSDTYRGLEGTAVANDPTTGEMLFYTDGRSIYDANHNVLPLNPMVGNASSTQSAVICPAPDKCGEYFIFVNPTGQGGPLNGTNEGYITWYRFNLNNSTLSSGTILVSGPLGFVVEGQIIIPHPTNPHIFWHLSHLKGNNTVRVVEINDFGINPSYSYFSLPGYSGPLTNQTTSFPGNPAFTTVLNFAYTPMSTRVPNPNNFGELAICNNQQTPAVYSCFFDATTGSIVTGAGSSDIVLQAQPAAGILPYGLEFSATGRYLYYTLSTSGTGLTGGIERFDYSTSISTNVMSALGENFNYRGLRRDKCGTIWVMDDIYLLLAGTKFPYGGAPSNPNTWSSVAYIDLPENPAIPNVIPFGSDYQEIATHAFPSFLPEDTQIELDINVNEDWIICNGECLTISVNFLTYAESPFFNPTYIWTLNGVVQAGLNSSSETVCDPGFWEVTLQYSNGCSYTTPVQEVSLAPAPINSGNQTFCLNDPEFFISGEAGIQSVTSNTAPIIYTPGTGWSFLPSAAGVGNYTIVILSDFGCGIKLSYKVFPEPEITLTCGPDVCYQDPFTTISASASVGFIPTFLTWNTGGTGASTTMDVSSPGQYTFTVLGTSLGGCTATDSCVVTVGEGDWPKTTNNSAYWDSAISIENDNQNGIYLTGEFEESTNFDNYTVPTPGGGGMYIRSVYLTKFEDCDAGQEFQWVATASGPRDVTVRSMTKNDDDQLIYMVGNYTDGLVVTSGFDAAGIPTGNYNNTYTSPFNTGLYIAVFQYDGSLIHVEDFPFPQIIQAAAITSNEYTNTSLENRVYYSFNLQWGPNSFSFVRALERTVGLGSGGQFNLFSFNQQWQTRLNSRNEVIIKDMTVFKDEVFVTGHFNQDISWPNFAPSSLFGTTTPVADDAFVFGVKDPGSTNPTSSDIIWKDDLAQSPNQQFSSYGVGISNTNDGQIVVTGTYDGNPTDAFSTGLNLQPTPFGQARGYVINIDPANSNHWEHDFSSTGLVRPSDVEVDQDGVFLTGDWNGSNFLVDNNAVSPSVVQEWHLFACRLDHDGTYNGTSNWYNYSISNFAWGGINKQRMRPARVTSSSANVYVGGKYQYSPEMVNDVAANSPLISTGTGIVNSFAWRFDKNNIGMSKTPVFENNHVELSTEDEKIQIQVYPNPTKDDFTLTISNYDAEFNYSATILGVDGKVIFHESILSATTEFGLSDLESGMYFIILEAGDQVLKTKIIKQ
jgi:Secretion system C-terminal sorting domain